MTHPNWFLDENTYAGTEHLDPEYVTTYDNKAATDPAAELAALRNLGLNKGHILVDMGAGTGTVALAAAHLCRLVIAVDVSPAMTTFLRAQASQQGLDNIVCVQSGFLSYEHQGELADFVYSRHALHHLPDFWKVLALERLAAILKTGGVLRLRDIVYSCSPADTIRCLENWLAHAAPRPELGWTRAELETHIREEYSTFSWLLEPMLRQAAFVIQEASYTDSHIYAEYTCVKK